MYGYIRPDKDRLRLCEYRLFRSAYCGLCGALRRRGGLAARFLVNYDMTFLAMLLSMNTRAEKCRCPIHPLRKCLCVCGDETLAAAADQTIILAWWKLRDDARDDRGWKRFRALLLSRLFHRAYKKAADAQHGFAENTENCLQKLSALEEERSASLDRTADCFARILAYAADSIVHEPQRRIIREILYHVGRTVYILDAVDDLSADFQAKQYNPLQYRFSLSNGRLSEEQKEEIRATLNHSQRNAAAALELRDADPWQSILENILCEGLPRITDMVLSEQWKNTKKKYKGDTR